MTYRETEDEAYDRMMQEQLDEKVAALNKAVEDAEQEHMSAGFIVEILEDNLIEAREHQDHTRKLWRDAIQARDEFLSPSAQVNRTPSVPED